LWRPNKYGTHIKETGELITHHYVHSFLEKIMATTKQPRKGGLAGAVAMLSGATTATQGQAAPQEARSTGNQFKKLEASMRKVLEHLVKNGGFPVQVNHTSAGNAELTLTVTSEWQLEEVNASENEIAFVFSFRGISTRFWTRTLTGASNGISRESYKYFEGFFERAALAIAEGKPVEKITTTSLTHLIAGVYEVKKKEPVAA
jgi:hypothetical protein